MGSRVFIDGREVAAAPRERYVSGRWRVGRKVGRTIYAQMADAPRDDDPLIGVMDTPALARAAVDAHNSAMSEKERGA